MVVLEKIVGTADFEATAPRLELAIATGAVTVRPLPGG